MTEYQGNIYYWMDSWPHFIDLLRNEKLVHFLYDDSNNTAQIRSVPATVPGRSSRFADRFIKAHLLSEKIAKTIAMRCLVPSDSSS